MCVILDLTGKIEGSGVELGAPHNWLGRPRKAYRLASISEEKIQGRQPKNESREKRSGMREIKKSKDSK